MSSIIKALRKAEEDRRRSSLSTQNFLSGRGDTHRKPGALLPLVTGVVLGAVLVGLFFVWQAGDQGSSPARQADKETAAPASPAGQPRVADPLVHQGNLPVASPRPLTAAEETLSREPVPVVVMPAETSVAGVADRKTTKPAVHARSPEKMLTSPAPDATVQTSAALHPAKTPGTRTTAASVSTTLPVGISLRVSEIYFQEDGASSMAVVNDLPVMIGSRIDSAVIKEIHPDSVLVAIGDKLYSVSPTSQ